MGYRKNPPRGYRSEEFPLPHEFTYNFGLHAENNAKDSTICTILRSSKAATGMEAIEVNPAHGSFAEDAGPLICNGSIVPKISLRLSAHITAAAANATTFPLKELLFNWAPMYGAFKDDWTASDIKTGVKISDIVEVLIDTTTNDDVTPLFTSAGSLVGTHPLSTVTDAEAFGDYNLTGTADMESVAFDKALYFDARSYYSISGKLAKVMPKINTVRVHAERAWHYYSNNFTNPIVKRGNPFTFCGILFHLPNCGSGDQIFDCGDVTDIEHLRITAHIRFDEWNQAFDQTPI